MDKTTFWELLQQDSGIVIPINQREYAQGRLDKDTTRIRENFVTAIGEAILSDKPLGLDLIYGSKEEYKFLPYDGQQRLTTLFLLHWLIGARAGKLDEYAKKQLHSFRYALREETERFCNNLIDRLSPQKTAAELLIDAEIKDQPWFDPQWNRDPSIAGMLVMLRALDIRFQDCDYSKAWQKLTETPAIVFTCEEIGTLGEDGETLYITMNSRGKQLTDFEKLKPLLLGFIKKYYSTQTYENFCLKIDGAWLDLFWRCFGKPAQKHRSEITDESFFNFLWFFCDLLRYLQPEDREIKQLSGEQSVSSLFERIEQALARDQAIFWPGHTNLDLLEECLDLLAKPDTDPASRFADIFYAAGTEGMPQPDRISWFENDANLFAAVCRRADNVPNYTRHMLMGFLLWLVTKQEDKTRLRCLRNIVINSTNEFRYDAKHEAYPASQLKGMSELILDKVIDPDCRYNTRQLKEELAKCHLLAKRPDLTASLYWLEDHPLLRANLSLALDKSEQFDPANLANIYHFFNLAMSSDPLEWDLFIAAWISYGALDWWAVSYPNSRSPTERLLLYNAKTAERRELFSRQDNNAMPCTRTAICQIAAATAKAADKDAVEKKLTAKISAWLQNQDTAKEHDWRWYFAKYPAMLPDYSSLPGDQITKGYYHWNYSPWGFLQRALQFSRIAYANWNPFLWAVWIEAKLYETDADQPAPEFVYGGTAASKNYIAFPCGLTLWPAEFGWLILTASGNKPHSASFRDLQKKFPVNDNGYLYLPGKNHIDGATKTNMDTEWKENLDKNSDRNYANWRLTDNSDRIENGAKLALEMLAL